MRLLGIALAFATTALATPVPFWGFLGVGNDTHDVCLADTPNGCGFPAGTQFGFSDAGLGHLFLFHPPPVGNYYNLSFDFGVEYFSFDVSANNGSITAVHHSYPGPYDYRELGNATGHIFFDAKPVFIPPPNPCCLPRLTVDVPVVIVGRLRAWTAEESASASAPFFDYQITGTGTLQANIIPTGPWELLFGSFSGTAEAVPEPATWVLALTLALFPVLRRAVRN